MPRGRFRGVSLQKEVIDAVEKYLKNNPNAPYRSVAEFISEAIRLRLQELTPSLEHFNVNRDHVTIIDHKRRRFADVYFSRKGVKCELCMSQNCEHVKYALTIPKVVEALQKHGWKIEQGEITKKPP
jgi:hypothetical protein